MALVVAVMLAGCSGGKGTPSPPPAGTGTTLTAGATTAVPLSTATTTAPTSAATTTTTAAAGPTRCHTSQLSAALTHAQGAAGTIYSHLTFTNTSATACKMTGYPGVSFVDGAGHQIGAPVPKVPGYGGTVTLAAGGGTAAALFAYHDVVPNTSPECTPAVAAAGLRIYPPGETAALFVADATMACPNPTATDLAGISAVTTPASLPG